MALPELLGKYWKDQKQQGSNQCMNSHSCLHLYALALHNSGRPDQSRTRSLKDTSELGMLLWGQLAVELQQDEAGSGGFLRWRTWVQ